MIGRWAILLVLCTAGVWAQQPGAQDDTILRAMKDELGRAPTLRLMELEPPYYAEYSVHDGISFSATATLGALLEASRRRFRQSGVEVRVGSPRFDNSNYVFSDVTFGSRYQLGPMPLDDDYSILRQYLWLATDSAYKSALEVLARKRAALKNFNVAGEIDDFAKAEPERTVTAIEQDKETEEKWKEEVRALSAVFAGHPQVIDSDVRVEAVQGAFYFANTEGTEVRVPEKMIYLRAKASAQAPDGMLLRDAVVFHSHAFDGLPPEAKAREGMLKVAENLEALARAPAGDSYSGPVLFEARAAAQIFAEVLGENLSLKRRPVSEPNRPAPFLESELEGRLGSRVLPEWMDVVDDPTRKEWDGKPLFGQYLVDLEGVRPKPLELISKGVLKNFLLTRQPMKDSSGSNGRARLPGRFGANTAAFGNLLVQASETVPLAGLKTKLLDICRQRNKPYGIIVRKMDFPSSASLGEFRRMATAMARSSGTSRPVSLPILVYRLYPDGREELIRGMQIKGLSTRSFRDIIAASDEHYVFDFLNNAAPFALMGGGGYVAESSVVAPAVLFEDLQIDRLEEELPKPPAVPPPQPAIR